MGSKDGYLGLAHEHIVGNLDGVLVVVQSRVAVAMRAQTLTVAVNSPELVVSTYRTVRILHGARVVHHHGLPVKRGCSLRQIRDLSLKPLPEMMMVSLGTTSVLLSSRLDGSTVILAVALAPSSYSTVILNAPEGRPPGISNT